MPGGIQGQGSAPSAQIAQFRSDGFTAATGLRVPFLSDAFSRAFGLPDVRLFNMISEATPLREERPYVPFVGLREVRYSRPGLVTGFNWGAGPIRGLFCQPGVFGSGLFAVSKTTAYLNGSSIGTIPGSDIVRFAASPTQVIAVSSGVAWLYDGVANPTFTPIVNGVLPPVIDVAYLGDRFAFVAQGSDTFWYSELGDGSNELGLDFASNEDSPANTVGVAVLDDQLVFFGQDTAEFWSISSDANAPYTPNEGRGFQRGCAARDTICFADNALFWLGNNRVVYRAANNPDRISSSSIEDKLRQCPRLSACTAFVATFEGHEFYVLNIYGIGSFAYDISRIGTVESAYGDSYSRGEWAEWGSWGQTGFRGNLAATWNGQVYIGDNATNDIWAATVGAWTDANGPLVRQACAFIKIEEGRPRMDGLVLHAVTGVGNAAPPGSNPVVEMRYSDDMGSTFSRWRSAPIGAQGAYGTRIYWQRLGLMRAPGRLIEVRCSDPVDVAFSHLELNPLRPAN